jgi:hypothetical protein
MKIQTIVSADADILLSSSETLELAILELAIA